MIIPEKDGNILYTPWCEKTRSCHKALQLLKTQELLGGRDFQIGFICQHLFKFVYLFWNPISRNGPIKPWHAT